jgi:enoyl-CoA hydratase
VTDTISFEVQDDVAVLRMDDGKVNALSPAVVDALTEHLPRAIAEAKALVIAGRPGAFSAGFDLKVLMSGPEAARDLLTRGAELFMRVYEHPQPVVAAVTGHAIAGGALLTAACDVRIGATGAFKIGLNEIQAGMPVPILAHDLARDRLDPRKLTEAVLCARMYTPGEAIEVGWLDRVAEADELVAECVHLAKELSQLAQAPYARTKKSLRKKTIDHIRDTLEADLASFG